MVVTVTSAGEFAVHTEPSWRARSNFIICAELPEADRPKKFEQLFARQVGEDRFQICCIPFFLYDVALGDVVSTRPSGDRTYVVDAVVERSGRFVFRIWFGDSLYPRDVVADDLIKLGALLEWSSVNLIAVDAADADQARVVADYLAEQERAGHLAYETGRS